jgi:plastocyanin
MSTPRLALAAALTPLTALVVVLAACGGGSSGGAGTASGTAASRSTPAGRYGGGASSTGAGPGTVAGTAVTATEQEFSIALSTTTFTAGTYTFEVANVGTFPHNLTVAGPGVPQRSSPTLSPGTKGTLTVTLGRGVYELWCSIDGHKDKGMDLKITVT